MSIVLDNVASGVSETFGAPGPAFVVWVSAGAADIKHDGATLESLAVGDHKLVSGFPSGTELTLTSTSAATTAKIT